MNKHLYFWRLSICCALSLLYFVTPIRAQLPNGFISGKAQDGYVAPMGVVFSKDGRRMFVWEKRGIVWVSNWNGTTYVKQTTPVLDISAEVGDWRDFGFASICLDPNFDQNGLMYMFYAVDRHHLINFGTPQYNATTNTYYQATISRVTRYRINLGTTLTADYGSRRVLLGETRTTGVTLIDVTASFVNGSVACTFEISKCTPICVITNQSPCGIVPPKPSKLVSALLCVTIAPEEIFFVCCPTALTKSWYSFD